MIIVCPECSTKYKVSKESITKNGKKVKCIKCKHSWFQESVVPIPKEFQKPDSISSGNLTPFSELHHGTMQSNAEALQKVGGLGRNLSYVRKGYIPIEAKNISIVSVPVWLRFLAIIFLCLAIISGIIVFQNCLNNKFPFMEIAYDKIGIPSISQIELNNVIMYEKDNGVIDVNGLIVNNSKANRRIPLIIINFIDNEGKLITRSIRPPLHYLKPNEKYPFFKMIHDLPKGARIISVEIADKLQMLANIYF